LIAIGLIGEPTPLEMGSSGPQKKNSTGMAQMFNRYWPEWRRNSRIAPRPKPFYSQVTT
jgi:hypothetical protein